MIVFSPLTFIKWERFSIFCLHLLSIGCIKTMTKRRARDCLVLHMPSIIGGSRGRNSSQEYGGGGAEAETMKGMLFAGLLAQLAVFT